MSSYIRMNIIKIKRMCDEAVNERGLGRRGFLISADKRRYRRPAFFFGQFYQLFNSFIPSPAKAAAVKSSSPLRASFIASADVSGTDDMTA